MAETQSAPSLRELSEAATQGEWRCVESTSYGHVWSDTRELGIWDQGEWLGPARSQGYCNAAFVTRLVSDFRAGRLIDPTTLTEAVAAARAEGVREGLERAAGIAECLTDAIDDLRVIRDIHNVTACQERYETTLAAYRALTPGGRTDG